MKTKHFYIAFIILGFLGFGAANAFSQQFSISYTNIPAARPAVVIRADVMYPAPAPEAYWVEGYWNWNPMYNQYVWVEGYWATLPHPQSVWIPAKWVRVNNRYCWRDAYWHTPQPVYYKKAPVKKAYVYKDAKPSKNHNYDRGRGNSSKYNNNDGRYNNGRDNSAKNNNKKSYDNNRGNSSKSGNDKGSNSNTRNSNERRSSASVTYASTSRR